MGSFEPWRKYESLRSERLAVIAEIMRAARRDAVALYDPDGGDNPWCLGCRVYARTTFAIREASRQYEWLTVLPEREALRFTFAIGSIPIRFYRGDPYDPPSKTLETSFGEFVARQMALDLGIEMISGLRIAVETNTVGLATNISLVEIDVAGQVSDVYLIPSSASALVIPLQAKPIDLPPPAVQLIADPNEAARDRRDRNVG